MSYEGELAEASCKEIFTEDEWRTLLLAPLWALDRFLSIAEGYIRLPDRLELGDAVLLAFVQEIVDISCVARTSLVREVFSELASDFPAIFAAYKQDARTQDVGIAQAVHLVRGKTPTCLGDFVCTLLHVTASAPFLWFLRG